MTQQFALLLSLTLLSGLAQGSEKPVRFQDLPANVQRTATQQSEGLTVRGYAKEVENGKTFYEIQTGAVGKSKDILLDDKGIVVEVEQALSTSEVPPAVSAGLQKLAGSAKVTAVESVTKGGLVSYEAVASGHGKKREIAVDANGAARKP